MKKFLLPLIFFLFSCLQYGWSTEPVSPVWESYYTTTPPIIDGTMDEIWRKAKPLTVFVREAVGADNPQSVILRAIHTDDSFYVMAQWPDATKSDMRDPYVWNTERGEYERPSKPDDQFSLEFPMSGEFDIRMLTMVHEYTADVWHWKAGRGNPMGWADDKRHIISQQPINRGVEYSMGGHGMIYIARIPDDGMSSYSVKPKPSTFEGKEVDSFAHRQPTGSLADVRGKGVHDGKTWTLEMSRKFTTEHKDDAVIDPAKDTVCAIAVLNDELYWRHSTSSVITLRFAGKESAPESQLWDFEKTNIGKIPTGWKAGATNLRGEIATWEVISDSIDGRKSRTLGMIRANDNFGGTFNLCWTSSVQFKDGEIEVGFKAVRGVVDQGGGPIWRVQDKNNYYIARANPLENNFRVYSVKNGDRKQLDSARVEVPPQQWHTMKIVHKENHIEGYLNGRKYLDCNDVTFQDAGGVGLWTKADAVTYFDDYKVTLSAK
jgi:hypothetical protein